MLIKPLWSPTTAGNKLFPPNYNSQLTPLGAPIAKAASFLILHIIFIFIGDELTSGRTDPGQDNALHQKPFLKADPGDEMGEDAGCAVNHDFYSSSPIKR